MNTSLYRAILIWGVLLAGLFNIYPTIGWMLLDDEAREARIEKWQEEDEAWARERHGYFATLFKDFKRWSEFDHRRIVNLGLDLKGGIHMVLGFDINELSEEDYESYIDAGYTDDEIRSEVQEALRQQVSRRVHDFEASEPIIQALGSNQIQVQLPGEQDIQRAIDLIKKTAVLNFHLVAGADETIQVFQRIRDRHSEEFLNTVERPALMGDPFRVTVENFDRARAFFDRVKEENLIPEGKVIRFSQPPRPFERQMYEIYLLDREPLQRGEGLRRASSMPDNSNPGNWMILFEFNPTAGARFGEVTERNIGRNMAIVIDEQVLSAPTIRDRITVSGQITGNFSAEEARDLAIALNSGSMKVPVREEFTAVVDASLGAESVRQGVTASLVGIVIVAAFMIFYYHAMGLIAIFALLCNGVLLLAAMAYFNLTLTLPGIAGLILTMGMAVDANVLIFERIREELRLGHSVMASIENGFSRAAITILDANVTTLIAGLVLMQFGTGPVEGFAVVLNIGVCTSVFTTLIVSRAVFDSVYGRGILKKITMLSFFKLDSKIPFMDFRVAGGVISVVAVVAAVVLFGMRGDRNFGVDFREGTNARMTIMADRDVGVNEVRDALATAGFTGAVVQQISGDDDVRNQFLVRVGATTAEEAAAAAIEQDAIPPAAGEEEPAAGAEEAAAADESEVAAADEPEAAADDLDAVAAIESPELDSVAVLMQYALAGLTTSGSHEEVRLDRVQTVGPAVGQQLRRDALMAIALAFFFIVLYLWFRFELRFAAGAIVAILHDVLITLGLFALFQREINMAVIAALLTIIGYSLNDTIVVFDRIREDLQLYRGKGYKLLQIINMSVNKTLARTLITGLTTLFVVVVLFIFGGGDLNDFAFALIAGVIVGTYSSIFVASPVVYLWQRILGRHEQPTDTGARGESPRKGTGRKPKRPRADAGEAPA